MQKKITMQDVADRLGVSKVTVSKAIRGSTEISETMRNNILKTSRDMGYKYNSLGKMLRENLTYSIGIITADRYFGQSDFFYIDLYKLLSNQLELMNYSVMFHILDHKSEKDTLIPTMMTEGKIDGIIVLGQLSKEYLNKLLQLNYPTIFLDFYNNHMHEAVDSIVTDNFFGAYELTNLLIEQGHTHLAYVGNVNLTSSIMDRYLGFLKAVMEYNLDDASRCLVLDRNNDAEWLDIELPIKMPTAFVCNCDKTALLLIEKLKAKGYKIPQDISVVGFDDSIHAVNSDPQITTIRVNIEVMAKAAAKTILKKIKNNEKAYGRVLVEGSIIIRSSSQKI